MKTVDLKPAPGRDCPMPHNPRELLPAAGATVPRNAYWERRIIDGDAVEQKASTRGSKTP
ncbi:DUF2635 domain-containing protein [Pseudomonas plecoglossicida]|uniref:DUF2635 domain-containing protein n=1 Tax=Pseudomonas plecoglossicida TaxID=70775 RepID=UPI0015E4076A|nr:DUF2635 domain-containing protein [Pseudomonas plecoglossicida]MBA1195542.1 DUF2635 domain-containing protein [Pseudomonas plecoglossicida]